MSKAGDAQVLNDKEMEILRLLAEGYAHKEIAGQLGRTLPAVDFDIRIVLVKLGARNGAQAGERQAEARAGEARGIRFGGR